MSDLDPADQWLRDKWQFPPVMRREHPLYDAVETYNEDTGEVVAPGDLIEADYSKGFVRTKVFGDPKDKRGAQVTRTSVGAWRCRWRKDKVVTVVDRPKPTYGGYGAYVVMEDDGS